MASGATLALLSTCTWELANIIATHEAKVKGIVRRDSGERETVTSGEWLVCVGRDQTSGRRALHIDSLTLHVRVKLRPQRLFRDQINRTTQQVFQVKLHAEVRF